MDIINPFDFKNIDDFINAIDEKYKTKKRNAYDDESLNKFAEGRNQHFNNNDER